MLTYFVITSENVLLNKTLIQFSSNRMDLVYNDLAENENSIEHIDLLIYKIKIIDIS